MLLSTEPASEPSDDDELDTEDGEVNTPGLSSGTTQRARDGRTEATRDFPLSAPPAFASTSTNAVVGDNSRSQMKRKEYESLFPSKKRTRYVSTAHSDQDDIMDSDLDEYTKYRMGKNSKPAPGIFLVNFLESHVLIYLLRTKTNGWQANWSLSVYFFDNNE